MSQFDHAPRLEDAFLTRRELLCRAGMGMGAIAMSNLVGSAMAKGDDASSLNPLMPRKPHFAAKAKRVIHIFLNGGPSHVDTFDPKPALAKFAGKTLPIASSSAPGARPKSAL